MTTTTPLLAGTWTVHTARAQFTARGLLGHPVIGTIDVIAGTVEIDADHHPRRLHVTLDPASIDTGNVRRDRDLRGKRFLKVGTHPTMSVDAELISSTADGWQCPATLQVAGTDAAIILDATLDATTLDAGTTGSSVRAHGTSRLDLRDAGINVPGLLVRRYVDIAISAELRHAQ